MALKNDINFIIRNVTASLAFEGAIPSETAKKINLQFLEGTITSDEAIKEIKKIYGR